MYPMQQPSRGAVPSDPYASAAGPGGYPALPSSGQLSQPVPYPPQPVQLPPQHQQHPEMAGTAPSVPAQPMPPQPQTGTATAPPEQAAQPSTSAGGAGTPSPSKSGGGFKRLFGSHKQPSDVGVASSEQATSSPGTSAGVGGGGGSPGRRRFMGIFSSSNVMNGQSQQQQQTQQQDQQQQQGQLQPDQTASAPPPGLYPPVQGSAGGQAQSQGGGSALAAQAVPVVAPSSGLCSKAPPPAEEVARMQSSPLGPSKFGGLNQAPAAQRAASVPNAPQRAAAVDPQYLGPAPLEEKFGPYLRYGGYDPATRIYSLSVMMVIHQSRSRYPPKLRHRVAHRHGGTEEDKNPLRLWSYAGYNFWRWDLAFQLGTSPALIEYWVVASEDHLFSTHPRHHFHLPTAGQTWHWGFYSCNGFHDHNDEVANGGIQPLWRDVMHVHAQDPLHVMFGGGDQLYCDDVWKLNSLLQWTRIQDKPSRAAHPFSQDMVNEVFDFYFRNYTTHFGKEVFRDALAGIPQVMIWDDHDIFDGWGSYPPDLQSCPVFQGVYFVARRFYLLFQCHAGETNVRELNKGWGLTGLSWSVMLGGSTAVVGLDSRGERSRRQICKPASWAAFADQVSKLPAGVRHVVVVASVPLVYPTVPGIEEAMMALAGTGLMVSALTAFLQKTGLSGQIYSQFGEPELLDDLLDHWSARGHEVEKYCFVKMMQDLAAARSLRFSILAGDVHCAGKAEFQSMPKISFKADHRYMVQVISSAIGNIPPPDAVIKALTASNKTKMLDPVTREKICGIFENGTLLKAARNWCDVHERPLLRGAAAMAAQLAGGGMPGFGGVWGGTPDGSLLFQLRVEHPIYKEVRPYVYDIPVPALELPPGSFSPGPLPVAPPLPQPLMIRFQEDLVTSGVGIEAALPLPQLQQHAVEAANAAGAVGGAAGGAAASMSVSAASVAAPATAMVTPAGPGPTPVMPGVNTGQGAAPSGAVPPPPQQPHYLDHTATTPSAPPYPQQPQQLQAAGGQEGFGLQSDIDKEQQQQLLQEQMRAMSLQQQQQQQQQLQSQAGPPPLAPNSYPSMPPVAAQAGQPGAYPPPPQQPPNATPMMQPSSSAAYGGAAPPPPPPPAMYGDAGQTGPPAQASVPPLPAAAASPYHPPVAYPGGYPPQPYPQQQQQQPLQPGYPLAAPPHPQQEHQQQQQPLQPGYPLAAPPHPQQQQQQQPLPPQQGPGAYPAYYQPQYAAGAYQYPAAAPPHAPYAAAGPGYPPYGQAPYPPAQGAATGPAGYVPPPGSPYPGGAAPLPQSLPPPPPYGPYPDY